MTTVAAHSAPAPGGASTANATAELSVTAASGTAAARRGRKNAASSAIQT